jgi:hypothetical protein
VSEPNAPKAVDQFSINDAILITDLQEGTRVKLRNGAIAEVTANPRDGGWIFVRYLEWPESPDQIGADELAFCTDVIGVLP